MLRLIYYIIKFMFDIMLFPFRIIALLIPSFRKPLTKKEGNNIWGLSKEDKRIAREERMSDADYIEAEERDDDNLDYDD